MGLTYRQTLPDLSDHFRSGQYQFDGGGLQALCFANMAVVLMNQSEVGGGLVQAMSSKQGYTLVEYGCAEGDSTAYMQMLFPHLSITGIDLSIEAVRNANTRWPTVHFEEGSWDEPRRKCHFIFMSHCLQQMDNPAETLKGLLPHCAYLICTTVPWEDGSWLEGLPVEYVSEVADTSRAIVFGPQPETTLIEHMRLIILKGEA